MNDSIEARLGGLAMLGQAIERPSVAPELPDLLEKLADGAVEVSMVEHQDDGLGHRYLYIEATVARDGEGNRDFLKLTVDLLMTGQVVSIRSWEKS